MANFSVSYLTQSGSYRREIIDRITRRVVVTPNRSRLDWKDAEEAVIARIKSNEGNGSTHLNELA